MEIQGKLFEEEKMQVQSRRAGASSASFRNWKKASYLSFSREGRESQGSKLGKWAALHSFIDWGAGVGI